MIEFSVSTADPICYNQRWQKTPSLENYCVRFASKSELLSPSGKKCGFLLRAERDPLELVKSEARERK